MSLQRRDSAVTIRPSEGYAVQYENQPLHVLKSLALSRGIRTYETASGKKVLLAQKGLAVSKQLLIRLLAEKDDEDATEAGLTNVWHRDATMWAEAVEEAKALTLEGELDGVFCPCGDCLCDQLSQVVDRGALVS